MAEPEIKYAIELTRTERAALICILIEYLRWPNSTAGWYDVLTEKTTTVDDLMTKIAGTL
jgi:hypothetical protein